MIKYSPLINRIRTRRSTRFCLQKEEYRLKFQMEALPTTLEVKHYTRRESRIPIRRKWYPIGSGIITLSDINVIRTSLTQNCLVVKNIVRLHRLGCLIEPSRNSLSGGLSTIKKISLIFFLKQLLLSQVLAKTLYILICKVKFKILKIFLLLNFQQNLDLKRTVQYYLKTNNLSRFESTLRKLAYLVIYLIKIIQIKKKICLISFTEEISEFVHRSRTYFPIPEIVQTKIGWYKRETMPLQLRVLMLGERNVSTKRIRYQVRKRPWLSFLKSQTDIDLRGLQKRLNHRIRHLNRRLRTRPRNWRRRQRRLRKRKIKVIAFRIRYRGFTWNRECVVRISPDKKNVKVRNTLIAMTYKSPALKQVYAPTIVREKIRCEAAYTVFEYTNLCEIVKYSLHTFLTQYGKILPRLITTSKHGFVAYTSNKHAPKRSRKKAVVHRQTARLVRWARQHTFIPYLKKYGNWPFRPVKRTVVPKFPGPPKPRI